MNDALLTQTEAKTGMTSLLGLNGLVTTAPAGFSSGPAQAPSAQEDVSVAGVMLLSAMSVLMAIIGMVTFALFVIGVWWAVSHVPVPAALHQLFAVLHLTKG